MQNIQSKEETTNISDMCDQFNVSPRTLRFYESKELLFPIRLATKRFFTRRDQARLKLILQGKRFGFSLEDIRQLLNLYDIGDKQTTQLAKTYELAAQRLIVMESQRDELTLAIDELKSMLKMGKQELNKKGIST